MSWFLWHVCRREAKLEKENLKQLLNGERVMHGLWHSRVRRGEQTCELVAVACMEKQEVPILEHMDGLHEEAIRGEKEGQLVRRSE